jgi:phosphomannomutase
VIAPQLIEALNCEVIPLFCEVDGNFPNHHPDPGKPENLEDLIAKVKETGADIGLAFDGDGDRVGVVTNTGSIVYPDRLLMLFARDVVARNPDAEIIFDVKCTRRLTPLIKEYGGRPLMWKTGHSLIKKKMKQPALAGRRDERAHLLQGALVRFRRRHLQRRAPAGDPQQGKIHRRRAVCDLPERYFYAGNQYPCDRREQIQHH